MSKFHILFILLLATVLPALSAEPAVLGSELFQKGSKLTIDEIKSIVVADTEVEQINGSTGGVRRWKNSADGKFVASRKAATGTAVTSGSGEWKLTDNGQFCIQIEWRPSRGGPEQESWCRTLWRYQDVVYLAPLDLAANLDKKYGQVKFSK